MNFIHIADTHLGRAAFQKTAEDGSNLRETLIYENFLAAIDTVIEYEPAALVHAGDLFDTVKPKTKALLVALEALDRLKEAQIPVIMIAGNHSMQKNAYTSSAFEVLERAHPEAHFVYRFKYEHFEIGNTTFHCIPNMLHPADYQKAAEDAACYNRRNQYCRKGNHVLVTHGLASTIKDKRLSTVAEFELTPEVLQDGYDYIALGHYHGRMQVAPNAWYSGSIEHLTYGEIADKKGGLIVDLDEKTVGHLSLIRSPMKDLGTINCDGVVIDDIVDAIHDEVGLTDGRGDQMFQITLDFGSGPVAAVPADALKDLRDDILDLKVRVRSQETERQQIQQQDLHAIDYVQEWERFMAGRPLDPDLAKLVRSCGQDTLKTVMANHAEVTE